MSDHTTAPAPVFPPTGAVRVTTPAEHGALGAAALFVRHVRAGAAAVLGSRLPPREARSR